ncbi:MAG TPA: universal stress protein [Bradyrhizobium sp.]|uniref:universal stress protein n=1 Tax=Bradyrhizobium sp. TaxID=376 RepID=UPI002B88748B|nr:universal stress protein [Bradyrhizobium sp.]HLZ01077.1 universal stress protein [Bradyrhizobium sp.]
MIKDILVHIPTERPMRPAIDASISLAATFGAHLDAVALGYISTGALAYPFDGGAATAIAGVLEREQERAAERATTALSVFETEARHAGIPYECRPITDIPGDAAASIGAAARLHDLAIVLQPEADLQTFDNTIPTEILLQAGGPVLFVPYIFRGAFKAKRIGICWDGSRLAARALKDAMPFLAHADALVAISINGADSVPPEASPERLAKHLAHVGLPTRLINLPASRAEIQPLILSIAANQGLDMLVMGAYGHSRLQEGILGGVTRAMLRTMTVPTLMSH